MRTIGFVDVRRCTAVSEKPGRKVTLLPKGEPVRRKRKTIARICDASPPWSDESARTVLLTSRFLTKR